VARAWDFGSSKKIVFAPAMNTKMWEHPVTSPQLETLKSWGYLEVPPIAKMLACKTFGMGAMAEASTIVDKIITLLHTD
jgi:phosphopantothenoylcysteine decarboxylase